MKKLFDERGKELKDGQIIRVYHFTGARKKKHYMYKQVSIAQNSLYGLHLPIADNNQKSGYWLNYNADESGKIEGTRIVQCFCEQCISGSKDCY